MNGRDYTEHARSALMHLDSGCPRDEWVRIGMAAKDAGLEFDDFHSWSKGACNYKNEQDCLAAWHSFSNGAVKAATLFHRAHEAGWHNPVYRSEDRRQPIHFAPRVETPHGGPRDAKNRQVSFGALFDSWPEATAAHLYIVAKRGFPNGLRVVPADSELRIQGQRVAGWLALPARSTDGDLQTVQFVPPPGTGKKLNAPHRAFGESFFVVGEISADGRIYVCEGIGQAWACTRADYQAAAVVTFGCGRFPIVARVLRGRFRDARLVFVADRGKEAEAQAIAREVGGAWVEMPADKPRNYDANDYEAEHGSESLASLLRDAKSPPLHYRLLSGDALMNTPPLRYLVHGVLPIDSLVALYGAPGSGKSFLALDLCAAIADGAPQWFGRRVTGAPVTYCALEGESGLSKRLNAWSIKNHRPPPSRLKFVTQGIDLRNDSDVENLVAAVLAGGGRNGLLVLDTLNRAAPGADENASKDMGELIAACKELQQRIGGTVLLVHHTGKDDTKGPRGHSSLYAALDAAIEVKRTDGRREWRIAKSKDDEDGKRVAFALRVVELDDNEHGELVTSCVVEADDDGTEPERIKTPQGGNQRIAMDALAEPLRQSKCFGKNGAPPTHPCIELETAVLIVAARLLVDPKRRNERAREAIRGLVTRGLYGCRDGWLWRN